MSSSSSLQGPDWCFDFYFNSCSRHHHTHHPSHFKGHRYAERRLYLLFQLHVLWDCACSNSMCYEIVSRFSSTCSSFVGVSFTLYAHNNIERILWWTWGFPLSTKLGCTCTKSDWVLIEEMTSLMSENIFKHTSIFYMYGVRLLLLNTDVSLTPLDKIDFVRDILAYMSAVALVIGVAYDGNVRTAWHDHVTRHVT